ncbi:MAG: hypothetical protein L0H91_03895, partial [Bifidobacterium mongoliense]|nr:hypothetical protein [Bifidobacterium mongoliense]
MQFTGGQEKKVVTISGCEVEVVQGTYDCDAQFSEQFHENDLVANVEEVGGFVQDQQGGVVPDGT